MNCLENLIGLENCCEHDKNICYINDLVPLHRWADIAGKADVSGKNLFKRLLRTACKDLLSDLTRLAKDFTFTSVKDSVIDGSFHKDSEVLEQGKKYGRRITRECVDPYQGPQVVSFTVKSKVEIEGWKWTLTVDGVSETRTFDIKVGTNTIPVGKEGECIDIEFLNEGQFCNASEKKTCACGKNACCKCEEKCFDVVSLCDGEESNAKPFQVCVNCVCSKELFFCKYAPQLVDALKYRLQAEYYCEVERTDVKVSDDIIKKAQRMHVKIMGGNDFDTGDKIQRGDTKYWTCLYNAWSEMKGSIGHSACITCKGTTIRSLR